MSDRGHLAENVLHFARLLRQAGLPVGTDRPLLALRALEVAGIDTRADLRAVLEACLIDRFEHRALFEQAFLAFWRAPGHENGPGARRGTGHARTETRARAAGARRLAEALWPGPRGSHPVPQPDARADRHERSARASAPALHGPEGARRGTDRATGGDGLQARPSASDQERLRQVDFEAMTAAEWTAASRAAAALTPLLRRARSRREAPAPGGPRIDPRQLLRDCARRGGDLVTLPRRKRRERLEPVVVLVDVSGSMSRYSRMFLHFVHALVNGPLAGRAPAAGPRTAAFVFGTRLTEVTRALRARDPDDAVSRVTRSVPDFSGGTRIGACLREFNRVWAKRVRLSDATVLLVTDGLERSNIELLEREAARLERSCRRLIWLNPLLRYEGFEPQARGVRALLPHVAALLPVHHLESLERLADILANAGAIPGEIREWR